MEVKLGTEVLTGFAPGGLHCPLAWHPHSPHCTFERRMPSPPPSRSPSSGPGRRGAPCRYIALFNSRVGVVSTY